MTPQQTHHDSSDSAFHTVSAEQAAANAWAAWHARRPTPAEAPPDDRAELLEFNTTRITDFFEEKKA